MGANHSCLVFLKNASLNSVWSGSASTGECFTNLIAARNSSGVSGLVQSMTQLESRLIQLWTSADAMGSAGGFYKCFGL